MATALEYGITLGLAGIGAFIAYKAGWLGNKQKAENANPAQQQAKQDVAGINLTQQPSVDSFTRTATT